MQSSLVPRRPISGCADRASLALENASKGPWLFTKTPRRTTKKAQNVENQELLSFLERSFDKLSGSGLARENENPDELLLSFDWRRAVSRSSLADGEVCQGRVPGFLALTHLQPEQLLQVKIRFAAIEGGLGPKLVPEPILMIGLSPTR